MAANKSVSRVGELEVATSLIYGSYKSLPGLEETIQLLSKAVPILREKLKVSKKMRIILRPIKKESLNGSWSVRGLSGEQWIEIDPRGRDPLTTLCHEFVHAEQFNTGRMLFSGGRTLWDGVPWRQASSHKAYLNLPWEIEARQRQDELAKEVRAQILAQS